MPKKSQDYKPVNIIFSKTFMQINLSETIAWLHRQRADLSNNSWSIKSSLKTFTLLCPHVTKFAQSPSSLHLEKPAQTSTSYKCPFRLPSCKILLKSTMVAFCLIAVTSNVFGFFFFFKCLFRDVNMVQRSGIFQVLFTKNSSYF